MAAPAAPDAPAPPTLAPDLERHLQHLQVERRLAPRTLALYREALRWNPHNENVQSLLSELEGDDEP